MSPAQPDVTDHDWIMARAAEMIARGETPRRHARDPVNQPMINNWVEAIGDANPRYVDSEQARATGGPVAPPGMTQVWTMYGLDPTRPSDDPLHGTMQMLDKAGFTSVLGTNCDQTYARNLVLGEQVTVTARLESVVGPKRTGVGEGYFVTTHSTWRVGDEVVATMRFRVLKFKPQARSVEAVDRSKTIRPQMNRDSAYFWEGTRIGELRIQRCNACGELRHPPGPVCPSCHAMDRGYVVASGRGTVHSWLVHHAPQVPGKELPLRLVVVDLEAGVRMIGEAHGEVAIGDPVEAVYDRIDDELTLVHWRPEGSEVEEGALAAEVEEGALAAEVEEGALAPVSKPEQPELETLPEWHLPITRTLIVTTALATRDFQDVHHDPEIAVMRGTRDIFPNILTTTGLVQRYVTEWAGWEARVTACALKLGAPAYPGDTMTFTGNVATREGRRLVVDVVGAVPLGNHVNATVTLELP